MKTNNLILFLQEYKKQLTAAHKASPEEYAWPITELDAVFQRMSIAIEKGTYNKDGAALKKTCKALKIKHTYTAIKAFLESGAK